MVVERRRVAAALAGLGARLPGAVDRGWPPLRQLKLMLLKQLVAPLVERDGLVLEPDPTDSLRLCSGADHEAALVALLPQLLRPGDCAVDGGAHIGYLTLRMARCVGPSGRVLAFEPDPDTFRLLVGNLRRNRCHNVTAVCAALWGSAGAGRLYRSPHHHADHRVWNPGGRRASVAIELETLDRALAGEKRPLRLVKLDLQGAELEALRGMGRRLAGHPRPALAIELWPRGLRGCGGSPTELLGWLEELWYSIALLPRRGGPPVPVDPAVLLRQLEPTGLAGRLRRACCSREEVDLLCLPEGVALGAAPVGHDRGGARRP